MPQNTRKIRAEYPENTRKLIYWIWWYFAFRFAFSYLVRRGVCDLAIPRFCATLCWTIQRHISMRSIHICNRAVTMPICLCVCFSDALSAKLPKSVSIHSCQTHLNQLQWGIFLHTCVAAELFCQNANITLVDPITPNKTSAIHLVPMMNIKPRYLS